MSPTRRKKYPFDEIDIIFWLKNCEVLLDKKDYVNFS
jgi:hypothetical protein